jgi:hypothetical protein
MRFRVFIVPELSSFLFFLSYYSQFEPSDASALCGSLIFQQRCKMRLFHWSIADVAPLLSIYIEGVPMVRTWSGIKKFPWVKSFPRSLIGYPQVIGLSTKRVGCHRGKLGLKNAKSWGWSGDFSELLT